MRVRTTVAAAVAVGLACVAAACSGSDTPSSQPLPSRLERIRPTATAPSWLTHSGTTPLDFRRHHGTHFTIAVPAAWREQTLTAPEGQVAPVVFDQPGTEAEQTVRLAVVVDEKPKADAIEQSQVLAVSKAAAGVTDFVRAEVPWPGAVRAVFVDWTESLGGDGGTLRTEQLMVQVSADRIVNVVAVAPAPVFDSTKLRDALVTLTPAP